jgi:capsular exopolysaccharide synthesis family protein
MIEQFPRINERRPEYVTLVRTAEKLRGQLNQLISRKTDLEEAMRQGAGALVRMSSAADLGATLRQEGSRLYLDVLIGAAIGLLIGFGLAIVLELSDTSIKNVEDVPEYVGLEVIGTIPMMHFGRGRGRGRPRGTFVEIRDEGEVDACIVTQHDPISPISEAYRTLRTNFQFATIKDRPRTVMVTSAIPGEGKTTTAVNMGVTFADSGFRVLLVDTDLRRPHVHHVLKMQRGPGLADALRQGLDFNPLIRQTRIRNLWTISSGHVPPNPSELIGSERMHNIVQDMGLQFDLVLFDAPSILVVTDPLLLAANVDSVVLVTAANRARRETVSRARKLMDTAHANIAGVVVNGLEVSRRHYYYYYYYYDDSSAGRRRRWILS